MSSPLYKFFEEGVPVPNKDKIFDYKCKACVIAKRKKQSFRAQHEIVSNLNNHLITVHAEDAFWKEFLQKEIDKENTCTLSTSVSIFFDSNNKIKIIFKISFYRRSVPNRKLRLKNQI